MSTGDKERNEVAITRINYKREKRLRRKRIERIVAAMVMATLLICTAINVYADHITQRTQEDMLDQIMYARQDIDGLRSSQIEEPALTSLGEFKITHYCPCERCCGKSDGITYTGTIATAGRTIGVDPNVIPLGSTVYIDGQAYVAEDTGGGIKGNHIDMFVAGHEEALQLGVRYKEVLI